MSDDEDIETILKDRIQQRIREQMERHQRVDSNISLDQVVKIQLGQEREKLVSQADKLEADGKDDLAEFCRKLADEWLPLLRESLLHR